MCFINPNLCVSTIERWNTKLFLYQTYGTNPEKQSIKQLHIENIIQLSERKTVSNLLKLSNR